VIASAPKSLKSGKIAAIEEPQYELEISMRELYYSFVISLHFWRNCNNVEKKTVQQIEVGFNMKSGDSK
jgi:hypothetical protein